MHEGMPFSLQKSVAADFAVNGNRRLDLFAHKLAK
jgi:hypothetical protein